MDTMWIMTSREFISESHKNKQGNYKGLRNIWFNGRKKDPATGMVTEHCKPQYVKFVAMSFDRISPPVLAPQSQ